MKHINTLELKFYDNIKAHIAKIKDKERANIEYVSLNTAKISIGKESSYQVIRNFYEYYVDGKSVYRHISEYYWKQKISNKNLSYDRLDRRI
ncbi:hypothetical protein [Bernardetia sp.]|uniref:hypothetical protein n=1 Tax=Bernardetia sp. TaxID=1937974 RepID=UPI0025C5CFBF|nr:hypothetical protein [Bernardetia sp.]